MTQDSGEAVIVVGVDGSESGDHAVDWAAGEADQRGGTVRVVHAFPADSHGVGGDWLALRAAAERLLDAAADRARRRLGDSAVTQELLDGSAAEVLVNESARCSLVVVGSRGHGGFATLLLGSTSAFLASHAACPVAVVRGFGPETADSAGTPGGPIVVGVDDSAGAERALEYAFARASERGARVVAVGAWQLPATYGAYATAELLPTDSDDIERDVRRDVVRALEPWQQRYPRVDVEQRTVGAHAVTALVDASEQGAQFVVVGSRGRGTLRGMLLGSVSHGVLHHAHSPVIVAR